MKRIIPLFALLLMLFSVSSFARKLDVLNSCSLVESSAKFITAYKIRIIFREVSTSGSNYYYDIHAYVYDAYGSPHAPVPIPSSVTIYGSLTLSGVTSPTTITIPPSGSYYYQNQGSNVKLSAANLQANYLSTYFLGGIPISSENITFE